MKLAAAVFAMTLIEGNVESRVRVVVYEDLQCSDCAEFRRMLDERILPRYGKKIAIEHRDFPLAKHAWARQAAVAARFFESKSAALALDFRRHTLGAIPRISAEGFERALEGYCKARNIDPAAARAALRAPEFTDLVERDYQEGVARGVAKTPTVFVDGAPFVERFSFEEISKALDEALAR